MATSVNSKTTVPRVAGFGYCADYQGSLQKQIFSKLLNYDTQQEIVWVRFIMISLILMYAILLIYCENSVFCHNVIVCQLINKICYSLLKYVGDISYTIQNKKKKWLLC